jgi:hypothetical protein
MRVVIKISRESATIDGLLLVTIEYKQSIWFKR